MAMPWGTIQSLAVLFGPMFLPRAIALYRSARNPARAHSQGVRPIPPRVRRTLSILLLIAATLLLYALLPPLAPENIFHLTQSRLQVPVDVLFTRLGAVTRRSAASTARDAALRAKFVNLESRLLYCHFGPAVLADCPFCSVPGTDGTADLVRLYLFYALPDLLAPHLLNLAALAAATSPLLAGRECAVWRRSATTIAFVLAAADLWLVANYNYQLNGRATRLAEVDFFYWAARARRLAALAALDALLAGLVYLGATNRAFTVPPSAAERVEGAARSLAVAKSKLNAAGVVKNTAIRDEELRLREQVYWRHEVGLMRVVMEERDVVEAVNNALANRIDVRTIERDADTYARDVLDPFREPPSTVAEPQTAG